jgi:hypothetical protein
MVESKREISLKRREKYKRTGPFYVQVSDGWRSKEHVGSNDVLKILFLNLLNFSTGFHKFLNFTHE